MRYRLHGGMGSPYSLKMRALLRYRRIAHDWVLITRDAKVRQLHGGPNVIPVLEFPDGTAQVDSTPLIFELERRVTARSVAPPDPATAFLALLIEDMADEWLTKVMFHYRWFRVVDQAYSSQQIISDNAPGLTGDAFAAAAQTVRERQVGRMALVGCTPNNAAIIEACFFRVLDALQTIAVRDRFLFGTQPSLADFGVYGQLRVLSEDHTPSLVMRQRNPRVYDWLRRLDDASGIDGEWSDAAQISPAAAALLAIAADSYLPFLVENAQAVREERTEFNVSIGANTFTQAPFRYQLKCLDMLRSAYRALSNDARAAVQRALTSDTAIATLEGA